MRTEVPEGPTMGGPVNIKSTALALLAFIAVIFVLNWGESFFAPLMLGILLSFAFYPVVTLFKKLYLPRPLGAAMVVVALMASSMYAGVVLSDQAILLLERIPRALQEFSLKNAFQQKSTPSIIEKVQEVAEEVDKATETTSIAAEPVTKSGALKVVVQEKNFSIREYLLGGSGNFMVLLSQVLSIILIVYFILASGNMYKQKLVKITGETISEKKLTVKIINEINQQLERFFFVMMIGAVFVGVATGLAFWWLGLEQAALWGTIAGVASIVPYLGPILVFVATGIVAFIQFGTVSMVLTIAFTSLLITSLQGNILTPWMTSRASSMNAVAIFVSLLFWGWLWGPIGLIVGTPILMIVKSVCDHVENLQAFGELLGD